VARLSEAEVFADFGIPGLLITTAVIGRDKIARARLQKRIALLRGDAMRIPLAGGSADAVTNGFGIRNVLDMASACAEMHRVLKPGGRLAILEFALPTTVGFRQVYLWYLRRVLPRLGRAISRHQDAYTYLQASIDAFATPVEFVKILRQAGFVEVAPVPLMFGSVILYTARRG
jgi:demethylmenaquinone methyltransferase/2-methoxy-6-polyprenyl-1,4-benzoquinol methylase